MGEIQRMFFVAQLGRVTNFELHLDCHIDVAGNGNASIFYGVYINILYINNMYNLTALHFGAAQYECLAEDYVLVPP